MSEGMDGFQWFFFLTANWATALAYTFIPANAMLARVKKGSAPLPPVDQALFEAFIFLCGLHHWFHPIAMRYGFWWPNIGVDSTMAAVSLTAAYKRWRLLTA